MDHIITNDDNWKLSVKDSSMSGHNYNYKGEYIRRDPGIGYIQHDPNIEALVYDLYDLNSNDHMDSRMMISHDMLLFNDEEDNSSHDYLPIDKLQN